MLRGRDFGLYSSSVRRSKIPHADETMRARPRQCTRPDECTACNGSEAKAVNPPYRSAQCSLRGVSASPRPAGRIASDRSLPSCPTSETGLSSMLHTGTEVFQSHVRFL